jgi:L-amino acid N-acyltransferase YncA
MDYPVLPMQPEHWPSVREIYRRGIETGQATFATEPPDWENWNRGHRKDCRLIALEPMAEDSADFLTPSASLRVLGWTALSPASSRRVYSGVAEVSLYVARGRARQGGWQKASESFDRRVRGVWRLDASGRDLSRECRQCRAAPRLRIPRSWPATTDRQTGRLVERHDFAGAPKFADWRLGQVAKGRYFDGIQ